MRVARFEHAGSIAAGVVEGDEIVDLGPVGPVGLLADGVEALAELVSAATARHPLADVRLLAPVTDPSKFLAIGINYADHIRETGRDAPTFPIFFNKQVSCVTGPYDPIVIPRVSSDVDYEGELGIVIGRECRSVPAERALEHVAGFVVINDVTVRDWQYKAPTWTLGKSFDTHGPTGPWIVTPDEVGDPQDLRLRTLLNGEVMQDESTAEMVFDCATQIEILSTACTLVPGDLISTGTPAGVGFVREPPVFLRPGDVVRIEIDGVGAIQNPVVDDPAIP